MASAKKYGTADSMERSASKGKAKPKEKVVYDSTRSKRYGTLGGPVGGKIGNRTYLNPSEKVSGNRIVGTTTRRLTPAQEKKAEISEAWKERSSDALVSPRYGQKRKSATSRVANRVVARTTMQKRTTQARKKK